MNNIYTESLGIIPVPRKLLEELYQAYYFKKACEFVGINEWEKYEAVLKLANDYAEKDIEGFENATV